MKVLVTVSLICWLYACSQVEKGNIGYGKQLYTDNCLSCHNYKGSVDGDKATLLNMSRYDSSGLLNKLERIKNDQTHKGHLTGINYSDSEIRSLLIYIKSFNKPVE